MDIPFLFRLVKHAIEREQEDRLHDQYCAILPHMTKKTFQSFTEWKDKVVQPIIKQYDNRSKEDIMKELRGE